MIPAGMVYVVSPTAAVIMGDSLMYVVLPVVAVEFGAGEHFGLGGVILDRACGSADDLLANNARYAESFDKGNLPLPPGPVLAALRPKHLSTLAEGQIGGNRDGAR